MTIPFTQSPPSQQLYFPNVIKPELGDANGMFGLQTGCNVSAYSIRIYDRWGGLIFEGNQPQQSWNGTYRGKLVPPGVYVFHAVFMLENGGEAKWVSKSGSVAVVR
ncbi:MAG: gliding motility-associated C-terminal domain-containing protein [Saprospiraceae bacterium]|nr:gliding motility-associated C-terminal domain-containing protein [Saprospiraceae bacterium]